MVSSKSPLKAICAVVPKYQINHRLQKAMTTRNRMIHPQTRAMVLRLLSSACWIDMERFAGEALGLGFGGRILAVMTALIRWMLHRSQGIHAWGNTAAVIPKMKDGPALLQKPSIRAADPSDRCPACLASATARAPVG